MDYEVSRPRGYSLLQIGLHWLIAGLVVFQLLFGEAMVEAMEATEEGGTLAGEDSLGANLHIAFGVAILLLVAIRLVTRLGQGYPPPPEGTPKLQVLAANIVHWSFYALLFGAPITGLVAWYVAPAAADIHTLAKPLFIVLILVHLLGVAYHQFIGKDGVVQRMFVPAK